MALPSGYTQLEYIESSGTQYINTGFKPNQDTTVEFSVLNAAANQYYFGAWNVAYNNGAFAYCNDPSNVYIGYDGQGGGTGSVITGNHVIKLEKNIAYLDDAVFSSYTYTAFQVNYPLFLFGQNRAGQFFTNADGGIYCEYCKIYDNGTLVRYLVPVMRNSDSTIGMYDTVNDVFYTNSGSGSFIGGDPVGPTGHRTLIDGTSYEVVAVRIMDDGTVYDIKNGICMIDGTLFDIPFNIATRKLIISGSPDNRYAYAYINGTKYSSSGEFEFDSDITFSGYVYVTATSASDAGGKCAVTLNGVKVQSGYGRYHINLNVDCITITFNKKVYAPFGYHYDYWTAEITTS